MPPSNFPGNSSSDNSQEFTDFDLASDTPHSTTLSDNNQPASHILFNMASQSVFTYTAGAIDNGQALANALGQTHLDPMFDPPQHHIYPGGINNNIQQQPRPSSINQLQFIPSYIGTNAQHAVHISPGPSLSTAFAFPPPTHYQTTNMLFTHSNGPPTSFTLGGEQRRHFSRQRPSGAISIGRDHATVNSTDYFRHIQQAYHEREAARYRRIEARMLHNHSHLCHSSGQAPRYPHLFPQHFQTQSQQSYSEASSSSYLPIQHSTLQTQTSLHSMYSEASSSSARNTSPASTIPTSPISQSTSTNRFTKKVSSSLSCRYCDRKFSRSNNRTKHEMYIHYHRVPTEYRCIWKRCFKPFKRKGDLARHIREYHLDLHYRFECHCPLQGDPWLSSGHSRSSSDTSSRSRSRAPSGGPLFYKREAGSAARLCGCDPQGTPVYPWHQNADPLRRRAWDWDEIFENWDMVQWAGLSLELCGELELLVIQELARTVSVEKGEDADKEGPV